MSDSPGPPEGGSQCPVCGRLVPSGPSGGAHASPCPTCAHVLQWFGDRISKDWGVPDDQVTPGASFAEDLSADSIDVVELILAAEEQFQVSIPDEDAATMRTLGDVIRYIAERRDNRVAHEECC